MTPDEDWGGEADLSAPCVHQIDRLTIRTLKNGVKTYYRQCVTCGEPTSQAIAKLSIDPAELPSLPAFDDQLRDKFAESRRTQKLEEAKSELIQHTQKYREYLLTPEWRAKRKLVLERDQYRCQGCRAAPATQVHHLTYAHVFSELLFELVSVCGPCHDKCHPEKNASPEDIRS